MATNPTMQNHGANLLNALNFYHRNGAYPLDDTSVWSSEDDFRAYLDEAGSYRYPGQLVSITNGDAYDEANDKDVTLAVVRPNGTYQVVGSELIFADVTAAEAYVVANPKVATAGKTLTVKAGNSYELYVINADSTLTRVSFDTSDVPDVTWANLQGKPTSAVADIDTSVEFSKKFNTEGNTLSYNGAQVAMTADIPTTYEASKIDGVISLDNLPAGALERLVIVADKAARYTLTESEVQNGDTVKQESDGLMFFVKDHSKLPQAGSGVGIFAANVDVMANTNVNFTDMTIPGGAAVKVGDFVYDIKDEWYSVTAVTDSSATMSNMLTDHPGLAFASYTAGSAASVPWSGVTNRPTNLSGYGIVDAVAKDDITDAYAEDGKVVGWKSGTDDNLNTFEIDGKARSAAHADRASITDSAEQLSGQPASYYATADDVTDLTRRVGNAEISLDTAVSDVSTLKTDVTNLKSGDAIAAIAASKITGVIADENLPSSVKERLTIVADDTARFNLTADGVQPGDIVKVTTGNKMYVVKDVANLGNETGYEPIVAASASSVSWNDITDKVTTLAGYGITDAVAKTDVTTTLTENKAVGWKSGTDDNGNTYDIDGKAKTAALADVATTAKDSEKFGGQLPAHYATADALDTTKTEITDAADALAGRVGTNEASITTIKSQIGEAATSGILYEIAQLKTGDTITQIAASKIAGVLDINNIPATVIERLYIAPNDAARLALTTADVQNGDTVKVAETGFMYFVKDDTKLGSETPADAFEEYSVGVAGSVSWNNITDKVTTLAGYGITDAVAASEKVTIANAANAGKILVLNAEGKLDADITGHVDWANLLNGPASTVAAIDAAVATATHTNRAVLDLLTSNDTHVLYNGKELAYNEDLTATNNSVTTLTTKVDQVSLGALSVVDNAESDLPDAADGQFVLERIVTA